MKTKTRIIGAIILLVVMLAVIAFIFLKPAPLTEINGYLGGEKIGLFEDQAFKDKMAKDYSLKIDYKKSGSIDMVTATHDGMSYLFPASQTAVELYKQKVGSGKKNEIIFNTPLVIYTHKPIRDKLVEGGLITENGGVYYIDMKKFAEDIVDGKTWADYGLSELYGTVSVKTTDPTKSNSGNMFAGLVANSLNGGVVVDSESVYKVLPELKTFFGHMGYMDSSSADLFSQFLTMGMGSYPMIAAYENQLLEYVATNPDDWEKVKDDICVVYPSPTVYSSHVMIALDDNGVKAIDALRSKDIQDLAWQKHGFRTGASGVQDATVFGGKHCHSD